MQTFLNWLDTPDRQPVILVECDALVDGTVRTIRLSTTIYRHLDYDAAIVGGVSISEKIDYEGHTPPLSYGDIQIDNTDGSRDNWLNWVWSNRPISVFLGDAEWQKDQFLPVFSGVVDDIDSPSRHRLALKIRDSLQRLNTPVTEAKLGGTTDNQDKLLPITLGAVFNVEPLLIDPAQHRYQLHDGRLSKIIEVRDNGAPVSFTPDLASGTFSLNRRPFGTITADAVHEKSRVADLIRLLATTYGKVSERFQPHEIDTESFDLIADRCPQNVGVYLSGRRNVLEVCSELAESVGCVLAVSRTGKLRLLHLGRPGTVKFEITPAHIVLGSLDISARPAVTAAIKLGFGRNYLTQNSGMAGGIPAEHLGLFSEEWQQVIAADEDVKSRYLLHAEPELIPTALTLRKEAVLEAQRRLNLRKVARHIFRFTAIASLLTLTVGDTVRLTHPRFGLSTGKLGVIVGAEPDWLNRRTVLSVLVWDALPDDVLNPYEVTDYQHESVRLLQLASLRLLPVSLPPNMTIATTQIEAGLLPEKVVVQPGKNFTNIPAGLITGTVLASQLEANVITTNNLTAQSIRADQIKVGQLNSQQIDTRGLVIRDHAGNIIFGAGYPLPANLVSGLGVLAQQNAVNLSSQVTGWLNAGSVSGLGALAMLSSIDLSRHTYGALNGLTQVTNLGNLAYANAIAANQIGAGQLAAGVIYAGNISANQITTGSLSADRISGGSLSGITITGYSTISIPGSFIASSNYFQVNAYADFMQGINVRGKTEVNGDIWCNGQIRDGYGRNYLKRGDTITFTSGGQTTVGIIS